ncbi:S41 family peptidase [Perlabentimonas gracilis]|uniref:S41 family peptidase n=1 Tax=Perlabentimonas gracilis TaxID=2715279 RepID=UPI00140848E0|nr:S41 family peptidase [Perlabentimonas gracilis]NHB69258.1 hypothetical protein [Perlabentimonas gracilis]
MTKRIAILLLACFILHSCEKDIVNPSTSYISNFETFWQTMDKHYVFFNEKGVNWNEVYATYAPKFQKVESDEQALVLYQEIVFKLNDGHVWVGKGDEVATVQFENPSIKFWRTYLNYEFENLALLEHFHLAQLSNDIMYLRMLFMPEPTREINLIKNLVGEYSFSNGIIFDLRDCTGGQIMGYDVSSLFFTGEQTVLYEQYRNGANHNSFTIPYPIKVKGTGIVDCSIPIIVLTNRSTYSMGNSVASILKDLTNSTLLGERSGGGAGARGPVLLGNGWYFHYTVNKTLNLAMELTEDGINPDVEVELPVDYWDTTHQETGIDPQLDKALEMLLIK